MSLKNDSTRSTGLIISLLVAAIGAAVGAAAGVLAWLEWQGTFTPSLRSRALYRFLLAINFREQIDKVPLRDENNDYSQYFQPPVGVAVVPETIADRPAEWIMPTQHEAPQVMLFLHGGGYNTGSPAMYRSVVGAIARLSKLRCLVPDYRLAPEDPFPAALDDAFTAYQWLLDSGVAADQIVLAGDSAGGGLSLALMLKLREEEVALPAGAVLISPWTDLAGTGVSVFAKGAKDPICSWASLRASAAAYSIDNDVRDPLISPLYADLAGLPPLFIQVGENEILLHDSTRLAERAKAAGVHVKLEVWPGMWHVWHLFPGIPERDEAFARIAMFMRDLFAPDAPESE